MKKYVVGLVDDNMVYQLAIDKYIRGKKSIKHVRYYSNGQEILDAFVENMDKLELQPDIILLDINMPIMDGWEFLNEFRNIQKHLLKPVQIYILTSSDRPKDYEMYEDTNVALGYITKPLGYSELKEILDDMFE